MHQRPNVKKKIDMTGCVLIAEEFINKIKAKAEVKIYQKNKLRRKVRKCDKLEKKEENGVFV